MGLDPGALTREQLNGPVKDWLLAARPQLKVISTSLGDQLDGPPQRGRRLPAAWGSSGSSRRPRPRAPRWASPSRRRAATASATRWPSRRGRRNRCNALACANAYMDPGHGRPAAGRLFQIGPTAEINAALPAGRPGALPRGHRGRLLRQAEVEHQLQRPGRPVRHRRGVGRRLERGEAGWLTAVRLSRVAGMATRGRTRAPCRCSGGET